MITEASVFTLDNASTKLAELFRELYENQGLSRSEKADIRQEIRAMHEDIRTILIRAMII